MELVVVWGVYRARRSFSLALGYQRAGLWPFLQAEAVRTDKRNRGQGDCTRDTCRILQTATPRRYLPTMGIISDFIIGNEDEAREYARSKTGISSSNLFEAKGITTLELSTLLATLEGEEWQEALLDLFPETPDAENLYRVSDALLSRLIDYDYDIDQVAAEWADSDEMKVEPDQARSFVDALAQHGLRAQRLRKPMHLWNGL